LANRRRALKREAAIAGPVDLRRYIAIRAEPCVYCGADGENVDHIVPLSRGGVEHESNLVSSCSSCNNSKRARLLHEWDLAKVAYAVERSPKVRAAWLGLEVAATT
jgi:5-methylcytosine-specific restriction endonuclease McrA